MTILDICTLCRQKKKLRASHIIPRFVGKWLKSTSATGFLRSITEPSERLQDLRKINMLCENCEERLSKPETYFANEIFFPFIDNKIQSFKYDVRLLEFVISLSWRTLLISYDDFKQDIPNLCKYIDRAEETWRKYLLGDSQDLGNYEHHMFFFDYVKEGKDLPHGFQWYTLRAVDATLAGNEERVFAYSKFPWIIFVSSIYPTHLEGWYDTKIEKIGEISQPQRIEDGDFGAFLVERAKMSFDKISGGKPSARILRSIRKRPERYLKSESLKVSLAEAERARQARKEELPPCVKELVEIIERALEEPGLGQAEKQLRKWRQSMVADALAGLSEDEALKLDSMIEATIKKSKVLGEDTKWTFETSNMIVTFMVNLYCLKDQQRKKVVDELNRLLENKKPNDRRYIVVFSWNPFEPDLPYETGFFIS